MLFSSRAPASASVSVCFWTHTRECATLAPPSGADGAALSGSGTEVTTLSEGTRLGPYEITEPLGAGGMGEVYKGRDTRLQRAVAVKVISASLASDPTWRQRFDREARILASLSNPHVCPVFDVGSQDGLDFLVMEYSRARR